MMRMRKKQMTGWYWRWKQMWMERCGVAASTWCTDEMRCNSVRDHSQQKVSPVSQFTHSPSLSLVEKERRVPKRSRCCGKVSSLVFSSIKSVIAICRWWSSPADTLLGDSLWGAASFFWHSVCVCVTMSEKANSSAVGRRSCFFLLSWCWLRSSTWYYQQWVTVRMTIASDCAEQNQLTLSLTFVLNLSIKSSGTFRKRHLTYSRTDLKHTFFIKIIHSG